MSYPILGWANLPEALTRPDVLDRVRECGIGVFMTCRDSAQAIRRQLDLAADHGLKALICDPRVAPAWQAGWRERTEAALKEFAGHPAAFGFYVVDEPDRRDFEAVAQTVEFLKTAAPGLVAYVNAFGFGTRGAESFFEYVDDYARMIRPTFLGFDCYPISRIPPADPWAKVYAQDRGVEFPEIGAYYRDCYWEAWETFRAVGWKRDLPLWGFALATPHQHSVWFYGPVTEGTLRLEAFTGLAYGSRLLQYFTLPTMAMGGWDDGILDPAGGPSLRYDLVRRVNRDVAALGPAMAGLSVSGVFHTGPLTSACRRFATVRPGRDTSHAPVMRVEGDPVILSFLRGAGDERFLLVVNRHPVRAARLEIELERDRRATEIFKTVGGSPKTWGPVVPVALEPGDGRLFRLSLADPAS